MDPWIPAPSNTIWDDGGASNGKHDEADPEDYVSKHANGEYEERMNNSGHAGGGGCRNCGEDGHFARECPEPKKMTGECYNCGEIGHNKADCTNPRVARPFSGTCRHCGEEGHAVRDCPSKPAELCKNCQQEGHKASECTQNRRLDLSQVPSVEPTEAWTLLQTASDERDVDDFKKAVAMYSKAKPDATYQDLEQAFRAADFSIYLVAVEKEMPLSYTNVNLQGKIDCKYVVGYHFSAKPKRQKFAEGWPASTEENFERLADAGQPMEHVLPLCSNCKELGHISKSCTKEKGENNPQKQIECSNCKKAGHRLRDCPDPRYDPNLCKNCKQPGHKAAECTKPRSAEGVECKRCNEIGHFAKDCPNNPGGGNQGCRNCGEEGHMARECEKPRNLETVKCRNCDEMGHFSRDCPLPRDYSRVQCNVCSEFGHTQKRCPQANAEARDGHAFGSGEMDASGGGFASETRSVVSVGGGDAAEEHHW